MAKDKIVHVSGKRKCSVARATAKKGKGNIKINKKPLRLIKPEVARLRIKEPFMIAGEPDGVDINIKVHGGGWSSQAEATRLVIAKALVDFTGSEELKNKYLEYDRNLLVADTRYKETKKPGTHSNARSKRQLSFR